MNKNIMRAAIMITGVALAGNVFGQIGTTTISGNENTGFGGVVGNGSLQITNDIDGNLDFTFTRGSDDFNDFLVLYFDSASGGFTDTSSFTDTQDSHRNAISNGSTTLTFASGFTADYALAIRPDFAGIWKLESGGEGSHAFQTAVPINPNNSNTATNYTWSFNVTDIGLSLGTQVDLGIVGAYTNGDNSFSSDEAFGGSVIGGNPGFDGYSIDGFATATIPEPSSIIMMGLTGLAAMGLTLQKRRRNA